MHYATTFGRMKVGPALLGLLLLALVGFEQAAQAEDVEQAPVGWACERAFEMATQATDPAALASDAVAVESDPVADITRFDDAVRMCISPEEWATAAAAYPGAFGGMDPMELFASRCTDPVAGLSDYTACHAYLTRVPQGLPDEALAVTPAVEYPELPPAEDVPLPQPMKAYVPRATKVRWFEVRGNSVDALLERTMDTSSRHCHGYDALACVSQRWGYAVLKTVDRKTGKCTVARAETARRSVVYLPRWAGPAEVHPDVLTWWRGFLHRAAWHESMHIDILQDRLVELEDRLEGKSCRQVRGIVRRWKKEMEQAQRAFDLSEQERGLPLRPEYWTRP